MIFIFGAPRSGTSWLGKIFDSHPDTLYRAEPDKELRNTDIPFLCNDNDVSRHRDAAARYVDVLMNVHNSNAVGSPPFMRKDYHSSLQYALRMATIYGVKSIGRIPMLSQAFGNMNIPDFVDYDAVQPVIKSVGSMGRVGLYLNALPDAKVIVIIRHPCGHVASVIAGQKSRNLSGSVALNGFGETAPAKEHGIDQATLDGMPLAEQLAWRWLILNELAMRDAQDHPNAMILRYEDLCAEPEPMSRKIFEFCGLSWSQQTAEFVAESTASRNQSGTGYFSVKRDPLVSAMKWKKQMDSETVETVMGIVADARPGKLFGQDYL